MALSRERIVEAAYELLRDYGLQDVSMRRISSALEVRPGALYYHVPNKQELLRLVARYALVPLEDAQEAPFDLLLRLRRTLLSLRDGADLVLIAYALDAELPPVPGLTAALEAEGTDAGWAEEVAAVLMRCALGAVAVEQNASLFGTSDEERSARLYEHAMRSVLSGSSDPVLYTVQRPDSLDPC